jgi:hypothetical protein
MASTPQRLLASSLAARLMPPATRSVVDTIRARRPERKGHRHRSDALARDPRPLVQTAPSADGHVGVGKKALSSTSSTEFDEDRLPLGRDRVAQAEQQRAVAGEAHAVDGDRLILADRPAHPFCFFSARSMVRRVSRSRARGLSSRRASPDLGSRS